MTNELRHNFKSWLNLATNGQTLLNATNNWANLGRNWCATNTLQGSNAVFIMIGVNPNTQVPPSYNDPPDWDAGTFWLVQSNLIQEIHASNCLAVVFTITPTSYEQNSPLGETYYPTWKETIAQHQRAATNIDYLVDARRLFPVNHEDGQWWNADGIHPQTNVYKGLGVYAARALNGAKAWLPGSGDAMVSAAMELPDKARYSGSITWQPGTNETVSLNPPVFSWSYMSNQAYSADYFVYPNQFQFQVSYDSGFASLAVDKRVVYNFWNLIAPFTNTSTTTNLTMYWRVGYLDQTGTTTNGWTPTRTFFVASNAVVWDRSHITTNSYVTQQMVHPFLSFRGADRTSYTNFLFSCKTKFLAGTGDQWEREIGAGWSNAQFRATWATTSCWWTVYDPTAATNAGCSAVGVQDWCDGVRAAAFVYSLTRDTTLSNAAPWDAANRLAQKYLDAYWDQKGNTDISQDFSEIRTIASAYDWLYEWMTPTQRTNLLAAVDANCQYFYTLGGGPLFLIPPTGPNSAVWTNRIATNSVSSNSYIYLSSLVMRGTSHGNTYLQTILNAAMAVYADSSTTNSFPQAGAARDFFEFGVNYLIAKSYVFGNGDSFNGNRGYGTMLIGDNRWVQNGILLDTVFPAMRFVRTPFYSRSVDYYDKFTPVGYWSWHDPWGESGGEQIGWAKDVFRDWAFYLNSVDTNYGGVVYQHWLNERPYYDAPYYTTPPSTPEQLSVPFYFTNVPVAKSSTSNAQAFAEGGWVIGNSESANSIRGFTNSVGLVFAARPSGGNAGAASGTHMYLNDGNFEIWAYGVQVTEGGFGSPSALAHPSWMHYTVTVNGLGQAQSANYLMRPAYSYLSAFTNGVNYDYWCGDLTYAYPHDNVVVANGPATYNTLHNYGPLSGLSKMRRHVLWMRKKYFVIYDEMEMPTNSTFHWVYHALMPVTNVDASTMSFNYVSTNRAGTSVVTYVKHIVDPASMTLTNRTGTNAYGNPVTGENYYWSNAPTKQHAFWFANATATTNWHFLSVIYPTPPGGSAPTITRIDDQTVAVTNGAEGDSITFTTNNIWGADIVVDVSTNAVPASPVVTPTFSPPDGTTFATSVEVTISCATAGAAIHYTTDGSTPTSESATYSTPLTFSSTTTLKAIGTKTGMTDSAVGSATYTQQAQGGGAGGGGVIRAGAVRTGSIQGRQ